MIDLTEQSLSEYKDKLTGFCKRKRSQWERLHVSQLSTDFRDGILWASNLVKGRTRQLGIDDFKLFLFCGHNWHTKDCSKEWTNLKILTNYFKATMSKLKVIFGVAVIVVASCRRSPRVCQSCRRCCFLLLLSFDFHLEAPSAASQSERLRRKNASLTFI